jgi:hypothetical protein
MNPLIVVSGLVALGRIVKKNPPQRHRPSWFTSLFSRKVRVGATAGIRLPAAPLNVFANYVAEQAGQWCKNESDPITSEYDVTLQYFPRKRNTGGFSPKECAAVQLHTYRMLGGTKASVIQLGQFALRVPSTGIYDEKTQQAVSQVLQGLVQREYSDDHGGVSPDYANGFANAMSIIAHRFAREHGFHEGEKAALALFAYRNLGGIDPEDIQWFQQEIDCPQTGTYDDTTVNRMKSLLYQAMTRDV